MRMSFACNIARALAAAVCATTLTAMPAAAASGTVAAGRQKALQCQACHGLDGLSKTPDAPNLAGDPQAYLAKALNEFRDGTRRNEMMSIVAKQLSDQDIADLAAYYAAIEVTATPPK